jgi:hypothetical protein
MSNVRRFSAFVVATLAVAAALVPAAQASWVAPSWTLPSTVSQFAGSSCTSTSFCILAGYQPTSSPRGLIYKWNGTSYSSLTPSSTTSDLYGVSCQSTTFCMAVGTNFASGAVPHASTFNGTSWSSSTPVTPTENTLTELSGVSCPASNFCATAGHFTTTTGADTGLVETWNGSTWSQGTLSPPAGTTASELNDVWCSSTSTCTAVGWRDSASPRTALIYRYNGSSWSSQTPAVPAGATGAELNGVACPSATSCIAVGEYVDSGGVQRALAQTWNGSAWSNTAVPIPSGGQDPVFADVACYTVPSSGCAAVGSYVNSTNLNTETLAAGWAGSSWSLQTVTRPMSVSDMQLAGISCPTSSSCRAGGVSIYDGTTGTTGIRPAIEVGQ